jgi:hypothetical protein
MSDPYRLTEPDRTDATQRDRSRRGAPLLWVVLAVAAALNAAFSVVNPFVGTAFGVVVLGCAVALVARHYRGRR